MTFSLPNALRITATAIAVVLLASCASPGAWKETWNKPGVDLTAEEIQSASLECRQLASTERWRLYWADRWPPDFYDPSYMPPYYDAPRPFWFGYPMGIELEQDLYQFCMHSKGFRRNGVSP